MDNNFASMMGAGIQASASHVNLLASSLWNQRMQRKAFEQSKELQDRAQHFTTSEREASQAWSESMWNKENEYNTPLAQMERLQEAGINPNDAAASVANNGVSPVPSAPMGANAGVGSVPNPPYINLSAGDFGGAAIAQGLKSLEEARGLRIENDNKERALQDIHDESRSRIAVNEATIRKMASEEGLNDAQTAQVIRLTPLLANVNEEQAKLISEQANATREQLRTIDSQIESLKAQAVAARGTARQSEAQAALAEAEYSEIQARSQFRANLYKNGIDATASGVDKLANSLLSNDEAPLWMRILNAGKKAFGIK